MGKTLRDMVEGYSKSHEFVFLGRNIDLTDRFAFDQLIFNAKPDCIVHLAARVGGITDNANNQKEFLETNLLINTNVISVADKYRVPTLSMSSSCCYPLYSEKSYPLTEDRFYIGNFEKTNYTYALAKSCMMKQVELSSNKHICIIPCNLFGKFDHFGRPGAHIVPDVVSKLIRAEKAGEKELHLLGNGSPLRQFCAASDVSKVIYDLVRSIDDWGDIGRFVNVGPQRNISIREATKIIGERIAPGITIKFGNDTKYNGVSRKDIDDSKLQKYYGGNFKYRTFESVIDEIAQEKQSIARVI